MADITSTTYPNRTTWTVPNNTAYDYPERFLVGDRVVIKEGFYGAGRIFIVLGKSIDEPNCYILKSVKTGNKDWAMESALESKPYTRKEVARAFCEGHNLSKKVEKDLVKLLKNQ